MTDKLTDAERAAIAAYAGPVTICKPGERATRWDDWYDNRYRPAGSPERTRIDFTNRKRIIAGDDHSP